MANCLCDPTGCRQRKRPTTDLILIIRQCNSNRHRNAARIERASASGKKSRVTPQFGSFREFRAAVESFFRHVRQAVKGANGKWYCRLRTERTELSSPRAFKTTSARQTCLQALTDVALRHRMAAASRISATIIRSKLEFAGGRGFQCHRPLLQTPGRVSIGSFRLARGCWTR